MSKVLFLSVPAHGNVNPTLGLVNELVLQGEEIIYFSSDEFKEKIEQAGATYKRYIEDLDIFKMYLDSENGPDPMHRVIRSADKIIADILQQTEGMRFDYMIHSAAFPFACAMKQILKVPSVGSLAIFSGLKDFFDESGQAEDAAFPGMGELVCTYKEVSAQLSDTYGVQMPETVLGLLLNKGDLNFVYTSEYFISPADKAFFDDSYRFVGPPVYSRRDIQTDFPLEKLYGRKVIYISLGTVFSNYKPELYELFFRAFENMDAVIVMAAYNVDLSKMRIPENFIVRNYVPQSLILRYADAAITHAGMNSISDLIHRNVPFVSIPLGADQPELAKRAAELGATIVLDAENITAEQIRDAAQVVMRDPIYLEHIQAINESFAEAGGYKRAAEEIFKMKQEKGIFS
ncbi:MAG: glycosyl transferase [Bacteroidetes bacterium]|nr:glycosyl transferase [Bacteroidota bacterium]